MNQATNVNIVPSYGQRGDLHFSQYDVGRTATINLYAVNEAYTIPVGATVKIQATKPSGLGFDVACTFSGSVVTVVSTETMTAEAGRFPCELRITKDSDVIGTANFMFCVEASPHPDGTIDGDAEEVVNEIKALVLESEGYALGTQDGVPVDSSSPYYHNNAKWLSDNAVLSDEVKQTLLACFEKVAWIDGNGQTYYNALQTALNRGAELLSISAVYTQSGTVYDTDSLDSLKSDLVVTGTYDGGETETILAYTLSGSLTVGTSTITVSYGGKTTTFNVTVSPEWDADPTLLYDATDGVTLSNATMFSSASLGTNATETMGDGYCRLTSINSASSTNSTFDISDATSTKSKLMAKVRFISLPFNDDTGAGFRLQLSNGTNGSSLFERYDRIALKNYFVTYNGSMAQTTELSLNQWYIIELERTAAKQTVTVNGNVIFDGSYSTYYCTLNRVFLMATKSTIQDAPNTIVDVSWIAYYDKD